MCLIVKYKYFFLELILILFVSCKSAKNAIVYSEYKTFTYEAFFMQNSDTLTIEKIILQPKGHKWIWDRSQQACKFYYYTDSLNYKNIINPVNKNQKTNERIAKLRKDKNQVFYGVITKKITTGIEESPSLIWIHPFRENQYIYTEIAPFPEIDLESLKKDSSWSNKITMFSSWDNFEGICTSTYKITGKATYVYKDLCLTDCFSIRSKSHHSTLGDSYLNFLFHPKHGFVEMKYTFYDGTKIDFYMYKVTDKRNKK